MSGPIRAELRLGPPEDVVVPAALLGHNLEVTEKNVLGMLSNRVVNAKFCGPADTNGAPPPWRWANDFQQATSAWLDTGIGLAPLSSSQVLHGYRTPAPGEQPQAEPQLLQTAIELVAGETVEVVLWARTRHAPSRLVVSINTSNYDLGPYAEQEVLVDRTHWQRFRVEFVVPRSDPRAVLRCALVGPGTVWIDQLQLRRSGEGTVSQEVLAALRTIPLPVLRFPGGCLASNYRWRLGTGPVEHRPSTFDTANRRLLDYDFGTDEYLDLCLANGTRPHITVNIGSGTPQEAGEWAAYIAEWFRERTGEVPPAYFQVGNEDNGLHEHTNLTPEMFVATLRDYVAAIRAAHPNAAIIALAEEVGKTLEHDRAPWRATVLPAVQELGIETVAIHVYEGAVLNERVEQQDAALAAIRSAERTVQRLLRDLDAAQVPATVAITEWNFRFSASHWDGPKAYERSGGTMDETYTANHGLFATGFLQTLIEHAPRIEVANFYHLMNGMGVLTRRGATVQRGQMADLFALIGAALPGRRVPVHLDTERPDGVGAFALADEQATWLFLTNRDALRTVEVRVPGELPGDPELSMLSAPGVLDRMVPTAAVPPSGGTLQLPPLSILRARWRSR